MQQKRNIEKLWPKVSAPLLDFRMFCKTSKDRELLRKPLLILLSEFLESLTPPPLFCPGREAERARERYDKATAKLHNLHNQYVLAVCGARTQQDEHRRCAAPALLDALQRMQEDMTLAL